MPEVKALRAWEAADRIPTIYSAIQEMLGVSWVPRCFRLLGEVPAYLHLAWENSSSYLRSSAYEDSAGELSRLSHSGVQRSYFTPNHAEALSRAGQDDAVSPILQAIRAFDSLNPRLLLLLTGWRLALEEARFEGESPFPGEAASERFDLQLVDEADVENDETLSPLFEDIRLTLGLSFVPDEFLALGQWPEYLNYAWKKQRIYLRGSRFRELHEGLRETASQRAQQRFGPLPLALRDLKAARLTGPQIEQVRDTLSLCCDLLAAQMLMVSTMKAGLRLEA